MPSLFGASPAPFSTTSHYTSDTKSTKPNTIQTIDALDNAYRPRPRQTTLATLPPELHLLISKHLIYPDALSLKHTNRYFYNLVFTGVRLKVEWLVARRSLHLDCPNHVRCDLGSDLKFCRGSVSLLMKRRREHEECESKPGLGCLVFGTPVCVHRRKGSQRVARWLRSRLTVELWWVLLAMIPLVLGWMWMAELVRWRGSD